jgi:methionine synthase I (cobalamin-dependent)/5,10-methylenetetrahydrofolate reductase
MPDFLTELKSQPLLADGAMGSYLFELTGRLSEANHVYETFNVDQPGLIEKVHLAYLNAGAQCLITNTFGANRAKLEEFGLGRRVTEVNRGGGEVARRAITQFRAQRREVGPLFVLGSIGPTPQVLTDRAGLEVCYREQVEALVAAGVDALILETFNSLEQLELLINLVNSVSPAPPLIAEMTIHSSSSGALFETDPVAFVNRMAGLGVAVAGVNCCAPWDAVAFVEAVADLGPVRSGSLPLSVMPNGGGFQRIGNRFMTMVNPEFAGRMARRFADRGVRLIGGCCEMHPPHIQEMHNYLRSRNVDAPSVSIPIQSALPPVGDAEKRLNGTFSRKLKDGQFVVSIESLPPRGTDEKVIQNKVDLITRLAASGLADAVDFTDGSRGIPLMSPGDLIHLIRERLHWTASAGDPLELIPHFTGRDLNVMGVQSRLIGYHANRIRNVLFITGDPPKMSPTYPRSTAVFDVDSIAMIRLTHSCLNAGVDFGGVPLGKQPDPRTRFTIGAGVEPEAQDLKRELIRLQQKIDNGVDYIMTQPAFHHEPLAGLEKFRTQVPFLIGVMVLTGFDHAQRMARVPGVVIPDPILKRLAARESLADQAAVGREIAAAQIHWLVREGWAGLYLMSTATTSGTVDVLRAGLQK